MALGYTYYKRRLSNPPDIFCEISHTGRLIAWIPSRLSWTPPLQGRDISLLRHRFPKKFTGINNQEGAIIFETSTRYTLWDSVCTHYINPYFDLYIEWKILGKEDDTEVNGIGGLIKPKGIGTFILDLEYETIQIHNLNFKQVYYFPGLTNILISLKNGPRTKEKTK